MHSTHAATCDHVVLVFSFLVALSTSIRIIMINYKQMLCDYYLLLFTFELYTAMEFAKKTTKSITQVSPTL